MLAVYVLTWLHVGGHVSTRADVVMTWLQGGGHISVPCRHRADCAPAMALPALRATASGVGGTK